MALSMLLASASAQTQTREFDVASIKLNSSGAPMWNMDFGHGKVTATNVPLKSLITGAYDVRSFQLAGAPSWIGSVSYDITARSENGASDRETGEMLQRLLESRFALKVRREKRQHAIYALVELKGGNKMKPSAAAEHGSGNISSNGNSITGTGVEVPYLASILSEVLEYPVTDQTGLKGRFDFNIRWELPAQNNSDTVDRTAPVFTALEEQLGLKLKAGRGPMDMLVIEHLDRPSEN